MRTTLIALHGFSQNGALMRAQLGEVADALSAHVELVYPDGLHACRPESVERLFTALSQPLPPPPHLSWWDALDDGRVYQGWDETLQQMRELLARHAPAGLLGFSQGAILAGALAAWGAAQQTGPRFVVIVAGRLPRAAALASLFATPVAVPSLHVWGERDRLTPPALAAELAERFSTSERHAWAGPHVVPRRGPAVGAIVDFVRRWS